MRMLQIIDSERQIIAHFGFWWTTNEAGEEIALRTGSGWDLFAALRLASAASVALSLHRSNLSSGPHRRD
jgi:hypothetical protein